MTTYGFLADICAHPADDALRLIYADWLDEHDQPERAEFIRVQCELAKGSPTCLCGDCVRKRGGGQHHNGPCRWGEALRRRERELLERQERYWAAEVLPWSRDTVLAGMHEHEYTFRRGFVASVTLTLAAWRGTTCLQCGGRGGFQWDHEGGRVDEGTCSSCHGTGRTGGHGTALIRAAPLERVTLSDKRPSGPLSWHSGSFGWFRTDHASDPDDLPGNLHDLLPGGERDVEGWWHGPTLAAALDAVSVACLACAHAQPVPSR